MGTFLQILRGRTFCFRC